MKKILLSIGFLCLSYLSNAQCTTAEETLDEDFELFNDGVLPQNCWTSSDVYPRLSVTTISENKVLQAYTSSSPSTPIFIVSPELSTIDGNHKLSFSIGAPSVPNVLKVQVVTMESPTNFTSTSNFTAVGSEITVMAASTQSDIVIPASETHKYIAFRITSLAPHAVTSIDNVKYESTLSVGENQLKTFSVYPNPSIDKTVTISHTDNHNALATIYSITGTKVFETQLKENTKKLNLSELASGVYILKLDSDKTTTTKKLILK